MVNRGLSGWSWEEGFDAGQRARLADRIVAELDNRLGADPGRTLYAATGNPGLSDRLETALEEIARDGHGLRKLVRLGRPNAHVTADARLFSCILPVIFEFGPPEISVLAIDEDLLAERGGLEASITKIVDRPVSVSSGAVCMDFDSGDLVRIV